MKVLGYIALHYGAEYLQASIESYNNLVDKIIILYAEKPSYGHDGGIQCPETEQQLKDIVFSATDKAEWVKVEPRNEGEHRSNIWKYADGYDLILTADSDEVFKPDELEQAVKYCIDNPYTRYGVDGFINFWKSFNLVCLDGFRPVRFYKHGQVSQSEVKCTVYHFGYAQKVETLKYKFSCHGHKPELRENWIDEVYLKDGLTDLHPVSLGLWNAVPFDKNTLPEFLKSHPNFNKVSCL